MPDADSAVTTIAAAVHAYLGFQLDGLTVPGAILQLISGASIALQGDASAALAAADSDYGTVATDFVRTMAATIQADDQLALADQLACYCRGTAILTDAGERPVETLAVGMTVITHDGTPRPIRWIGHRDIDCRRHGGPRAVWPVRIMAHAFGQGLPRRDLLLSPDHAVFVDDVLIPIRQLLNGATIRQEACDTVTYYHVELDWHDVLVAEGLPAESYLDTGNRTAFANGGAVTMLHPDLATANADARRRAESYAPLMTEAAVTEPIWQRLARRAEALGFVLPKTQMTGDPALHLGVDGRALLPIVAASHRYVFALPRSFGEIQLVSRAAAPCDARPWLNDRRRLGVPVSRIVLHDGTALTDLAPDHPSLAGGWHGAEQGGRHLWRWTDGAAQLPLPTGTRMIEIHLGGSAEYPLAEGVEPDVCAMRRHHVA